MESQDDMRPIKLVANFIMMDGVSSCWVEKDHRIHVLSSCFVSPSLFASLLQDVSHDSWCSLLSLPQLNTCFFLVTKTYMLELFTRARKSFVKRACCDNVTTLHCCICTCFWDVSRHIANTAKPHVLFLHVYQPSWPHQALFSSKSDNAASKDRCCNLEALYMKIWQKSFLTKNRRSDDVLKLLKEQALSSDECSSSMSCLFLST